MVKSPDKFSSLFNQALDRIKSYGRTKESIRSEIARAIDRGVHTIDRWQRGICPSTHSQAEMAAEILFIRKGIIDKEEFELFLEYAGHPSPTTVWERVFPLVEGPARDEFNIFVGREEKANELASTLRPGHVVVLWGAAGVGKTSLVRKVLDKLQADRTLVTLFPHGVRYYEFSDREQNVDDALRYIAQSYGTEIASATSPRDAASHALRDKQALIILDRAEVPDDLRKFLSVRHSCGMLLISEYQLLDLSATQPINLDILPLDDAVTALHAWSTFGVDGVEFDAWRGEVAVVHKTACSICEELGRLPLALRLAGRYILHCQVSLNDFLGLWQESRLGLLNEGRHRHDSLKVLMESSVREVEHRSRSAYVRKVLAVAGSLAYAPFAAEVIAVVLEQSAAVIHNVFHNLWKFGMLRVFGSGYWSFAHKLIYTYAEEMGTSDDIITRLAVHYTHWVPQQMEGQPDYTEGEDTVAAELSHIRAVANACLKRHLWEQAQDLALSITVFSWMEDRSDDPIAIIEVGLAASEMTQNRSVTCDLLLELGRNYLRKGSILYLCVQEDPDACNGIIGYFNQAMTIAIELEDKQKEWEASMDLAELYRRLGMISRAFKQHEKSSSYFEQRKAIYDEWAARTSSSRR